MVVLYIASQTLIIGSFSDLEKQILTDNVERVSNALHDDITRLNSTTADWAQWDDAYAFIQDGNNDFIRSNLVNSTFSEIKLNIMMFVDTEGRIVYTKAFDLEEERETPVPQFLLSLIKPESAILRNAKDSISGIVLLPEDSMIMASQPIMTSEGEGPIMGTLIMGRFLDSKELELLAEKTRVSLQMYRIDKKDLPDDFRAAENILSRGETIYVNPVSDQIIRGYTFVKDVFGNPAVILGTEMPRNIYIYGKNMIHYFLSFFVLITGLFIIFLVFIQISMVMVNMRSQRAKDYFA